ncbi:hypothetical protein DL93DRAFT_1705301 [Clavulina sp. PMI_390]|nr:hypothetical protein DL93DRAFT_1705301 [Clavulina sp. PMI_390]
MIFLTHNSRIGEDDATFLDFSAGDPGSDPMIPVQCFILDGIRRALPGKPPVSVMSHSSSASPLSTIPSTVLYGGASWNVDSSGFGKPQVHPNHSWSITGAVVAPGWRTAHIRSRKLRAVLYQKAEDDRPGSQPDFLDSHMLLVDDRMAITDSEGMEFYRAIWIDYERIILLPVGEVKFEDT